MRDVIYEMSSKGLGMTCVVDEDGRLAGIITDGDLRRHMSDTPDILVADGGRRDDAPARHDRARRCSPSQALQVMEQRKITSLVVADADGVVEGVLHLHDLWRTECSE